MAGSEVTQTVFAKAAESLAGAASEFINGRYNNCANRCYYACFQANRRNIGLRHSQTPTAVRIVPVSWSSLLLTACRCLEPPGGQQQITSHPLNERNQVAWGTALGVLRR